MVQRVCDICQVDTMTINQVKVKRLKEICEFDDHGVFPKKQWVEIDICVSCLRALRDAKRRQRDES